MDATLESTIRTIHQPNGWVHLATLDKDGGPHVVPVMMGIRGDQLTFSLTGKQKKMNLQRDPRCCVSIARDGDLAHAVIWGTMELRHDDEAQQIWNELLTGAFGEQGLEQRARSLSFDGTSLGLLTPTHWRTAGPSGKGEKGNA